MQSANEGASLYLDLSSLNGGSRFALTESGSSFYGLGAPPTSAAAFACYAVNVTGPGIGDSSPNPSGDIAFRFDRAVRGESSCIYRGVVTPPILLSATGSTSVALQIPPGGVRLVQIAGVNDQVVCDSGVINDPPGSTSGGRFYEIGRAVLTDVFGDRSVDVTTNWPSGITAADQALRDARAMDCGDGICGSVSALHQAADVASLGITNSTTKYAFQLDSAPGKSIRKLALLLAAAGSTGSLDVDLELAVGTVSGGVVSLSSLPAYSQTITLPADPSATLTARSVDFADLAGHYFQMQTGQTYWIIISSAQATTPLSLLIGHNPGSGTGNVQQWTGSSWGANNASLGIVHDAFGCGP